MLAKSVILVVVLFSGIALAEEPLNTAANLNNQAIALSQQGKFQDAENLYRSALAVSPYDDLVRARIANNLAGLYRRQDRYPEAEDTFRRALEWRQKSLPPNSVDIAYSFSNLADIYRIEGRDWEARNLMKSAARILTEYHPDASGLPVILSNLAVVLCKFHEWDEAEELLRTALEGSEREHGAVSREVGIATNNLAQVLRGRNDFDRAAELYGRAVSIFETLGPESTPDLATVLANTGQLLEQKHQSDQARQAEQHALDLLGADGNGPLRAVILQNLGNIEADAGNPTGSLPYFERSLNIQEKALGSEHPAVVRLLFDYAAATLRAGQKSLAHKLRKRAQELAARRQNAAPDQFTVSVDSLRAAE